jgi:hypothetical protein
MPEVISGLTLEKGAHADVQQPIKGIQTDSLASLGNGLFCERNHWFSNQFCDCLAKRIQEVIYLVGEGLFLAAKQEHHDDAHCQLSNSGKAITDAVLLPKLVRMDAFFDSADNRSANL